MMAKYRREISVAAAWLLMLAALAVVAPAFFKPDQILSMLVSSAPVLIAAIGMSLVIMARQIDISIGSQYSICAVVAGLLAQNGASMLLVVLAAVATGAAIGATNGILIAALRLPSIVVTLATLVIWRESLRWLRQGEFVRNLPSSFQWFGAGQSSGQWLVLLVALAVFLVVAWGLRNLPVGRAVYATGSDEEAARLAGIRPRLVIFLVFAAMGALAGMASLCNAVRFSDIDPNSGLGLELRVIAAVVVGGVAITGGRGTLAGCLLGVLLLATIGPALVFFGLQPQWEKAIQGLIILIAVASDAFEHRRQ